MCPLIQTITSHSRASLNSEMFTRNHHFLYILYTTLTYMAWEQLLQKRELFAWTIRICTHTAQPSIFIFVHFSLLAGCAKLKVIRVHLLRTRRTFLWILHARNTSRTAKKNVLIKLEIFGEVQLKTRNGCQIANSQKLCRWLHFQYLNADEFLLMSNKQQ